MKKRDYMIIGIGVACMILTIVIGMSYAYWKLSKVQSGVNVVNTTCFDIEFTEGNAITLSNAIPISDEEGLAYVPYTFTLSNKCGTWAEYQINLEALEQGANVKVLPDTYIHEDLQEDGKQVSNSKLKTEMLTSKTLEEAKSAYKLHQGTLKTGETKEYALRIWMDKDVGMDNASMNASFKAKITIEFSAIYGDTDSEEDSSEETYELTYKIDGKKVEANEIPKIEEKDNYDVNVNCGATAEAVWDSEIWNINFVKKNKKAIACTIEFTSKKSKVEIEGDIETIGAEVSIGEEHFFVIANDDDKITLLSKYNLEVLSNPGTSDAIIGTVQKEALSAEYLVVFSTAKYWSCLTSEWNASCKNEEGEFVDLNEIENENATAVNAAKTYGKTFGEGVTGRLLTNPEAIALSTSNSNILYGKYTKENCLIFWLSTADSETQLGSTVWQVYGRSSTKYSTNYDIASGGVRPVIEISKSLIKTS